MQNVKVCYMQNSNDSFVKEIDADKAIKEEYKKGYKKGYKQALKDINTPKKVIIEKYEPSVCPRCKETFSEFEPCDDGYYERAYNLERCPYCGQKIVWE